MSVTTQNYAGNYAAMAAPVTYAAAPAMMTTMAAPVSYAAAPTMAYAAPAVTTMAAPVSYAAAPMASYGTTTMAAPVTYAAPSYAAAPITTTMAAPVTYATPSYTPAPVTYAAPSYAAPAMTYAAPAMIGGSQSYVASPDYAINQWQAQSQAMPTLGVAMPKIEVGPAPTDLCVGIPNSQQIASQKAGYAAALDKQLADGIATIQKETEIEKQMVKFTSDKSLSLFNMSVDEKLAESVAIVDEQATIQGLELKKALVERNLQLNAQAQGLVMDYQMKAVQTELAKKQYDFQVEYMAAENKLAVEYRAQAAKANVAF